LSNEEKTNDYENFEKGMIYMKILKKEKRGEEETKSMPHVPV
jgi:CTP synthase (UTP-ammonia lyase)